MYKGASVEVLQACYLTDKSIEYNYLPSMYNNVNSNKGQFNDRNDYVTTVSCMESIGVNLALQPDIFALLAGILHLGNIDFVSSSHDEVEVQGIPRLIFIHISYTSF